MSLIRRMIGVTETRDATPWPGYGVQGQGKWGNGMVWEPWGSAANTSTDQAMRLSAVFACIRLLSEAIAAMPNDVFIRRNGVPSVYRPKPDFLSFQPPHQSRIEYFSMLMLSFLTDGNVFIGTPRNAMGVVLDLIILDPTRVKTPIIDGVQMYKVGSTMFTDQDITHIKGMTMPGAPRGMSPLGYARDVIDGESKAQDWRRNFMANGAVPPAVIEIPGDASDTEAARGKAERIKAGWNVQHAGAGNAGKIGVLLGGAKLTTVAINPSDAEWLDSKKFGISEICRFFGVPPHLAADASNSTSWGSGLMEQNSAFGAFSLRPWVERIEDGHARLLTTMGMPDVYLKLNVDSLLRADTAERYLTYATAIGWHIRTPNECRQDEDLPPLPGGDEFPDLMIPPPTPKLPKGI